MLHGKSTLQSHHGMFVERLPKKPNRAGFGPRPRLLRHPPSIAPLPGPFSPEGGAVAGAGLVDWDAEDLVTLDAPESYEAVTLKAESGGVGRERGG